MAWTLKNQPEEEFEQAGLAVIEHHFDNHQFCGDWCQRKQLNQQQPLESKQFYRCKQKDTMLYAVLMSKVQRFITLDCLKEISHGMDTQVNESFNNTLSLFAPKYKVYAGWHCITEQLSMYCSGNSLDWTHAIFHKVDEDNGNFYFTLCCSFPAGKAGILTASYR